MALEIEHKFLLVSDDWRSEVDHSMRFQQGYLGGCALNSIRVRISDTQAWLNVKSASIGDHRLEFEYEIPLADAQVMLKQLCHQPQIDKIRHFVNRGSHVWEIDEFLGDNQGLIVAEI